MEPLYKIVGPAGECLNGGTGDWPLPQGDLPGEWRSVDGPLVTCRNGLHLASAAQLPAWLPSAPCVVYRVETDGSIVDAGDKYVAQRVRLLPRTRPMPADPSAAIARARAKRDAARLAIPEATGYLRAIRHVTLPAGHPLAVQVATLRDRERAAEAARDKAERAYARAIVRAVMP